MKSGKIKKTTSYIMAIPMNDKDIDTPQMVYDRINAHDEFELKETSFDDKNMCPMVTVVYKGQQYIVDIKIEPVNITPDFMFCHDMPDECIKKMKKAKIGITTGNTIRTSVPAHLFVATVLRIRVRIRVLLLLLTARLLLRVFRFGVQFPVCLAVFLIVGIHLHSDFELFLALVRPIFLVEHNRLQIVPFRRSFIEIVELCLRL